MAQTHGHRKDTMRAVVFDGTPFEVQVRSVPKAKVVEQTDAVVRVTTAAICGSDLHIYHGVFGSVDVPYPLGHEAMGIVVEVGEAVGVVKVGDRVIIPDLPDDGTLDVEPAINLTGTISIYGGGDEFGNLGGGQGMYKTLRKKGGIKTW
jgi:threonine dehydrogenase-like Zn-dependent dehydrogenase